ncbi:MAG: VacJ family lipoprotein [Proteobacteria bacterium]|nr:VacJ family lipoprotein [Pseudomonadota bacterium]
MTRFFRSHRRYFRARALGPLLAVLMTAACATPAMDDGADDGVNDGVNDPLESMNRTIFSFNQFAEGLLFKPLAIFYRDLVPPEVQDAVGGILETLHTPVTLANDLLQGEPDRAIETLGRFAINGSLGIGGIFDVAAEFGLEGHDEDFGQTLAVWGSGEGMYLVLPLFGPSNVRDGIGLGVDAIFDPLTYYAGIKPRAGRSLVNGIDELSGVVDSLDEIERTSLDYYATLRSLYRQQRADQIRNGAAAPVVPIPSLSLDDFDSPVGELITLAE